jgi:23S rRNA (uracil1939-C5)-methyltransferase
MICKRIGLDEFLNQNLYDQDALTKVTENMRNIKDFKLTHLLLDPPRSGFKELSIWLNTLKPKFVTYISCDPHTLARDLEKISGYDFTKTILLDFFPSTFHFESMIFLKRTE